MECKIVFCLLVWLSALKSTWLDLKVLPVVTDDPLSGEQGEGVGDLSESVRTGIQNVLPVLTDESLSGEQGEGVGEISKSVRTGIQNEDTISYTHFEDAVEYIKGLGGNFGDIHQSYDPSDSNLSEGNYEEIIRVAKSLMNILTDCKKTDVENSIEIKEK